MKALQLSRTLRPRGVDRVPPIDAVEHVGELRERDSNNAGLFRPGWQVASLDATGV
jgi:hypothetical protein